MSNELDKNLPVVQNLLNWQPEAYQIHAAGKCPDCNYEHLLFYKLPSRGMSGYQGGWLVGGFYCGACNWSNAGTFLPERLQVNPGDTGEENVSDYKHPSDDTPHFHLMYPDDHTDSFFDRLFRDSDFDVD